MKGIGEMNMDFLKKLVRKAKNGDQGAFSTIYNTYFTPLFRYIYFRVKSKEEAEDLTQNVFMKIYMSLEHFAVSEISPAAYFFTAARNAVIDYFRRKNHLPIASDEIVELHSEIESTGERDIEKKEIAEMVRASLEVLTPDQREVVTLKFLNELSNKEIAELTGKSEVAIRQIQSRALKTLKEHFKNNKLL